MKTVAKILPFIACLLPAQAPCAVVAQEVGDQETMSWLDNGEIRLGVDLTIGGAITYLADSTSRVNMINSHDWGRQIQMSFYSGPNPFVPEGATVAPNWEKLGWNPIQSGDAFGHRSQVVEHRNDGETIYVKCVPKHWPLNNRPGQCEFECWFRLEGKTVQARSRLTNHRDDETQHPGRSQELPAVYTNGPWYKLVSYLGDEPFTDAEPTVLVDREDGKGWPWRSFYTPEHWAALVDENDHGLGVYLPGACSFLGGFAGSPKGQGGPKDNPTGYMTPLKVAILDHDIAYTYDYALIVGSLDEIRAYVYEHRPSDAPPTWRFDDQRRGWTYRTATDAGWPIEDRLIVTWTADNAALVGPKTFWKADAAPKLVIDAAFKTDATHATLAIQPFDAVDAGDWVMGNDPNRPKAAPAIHVPFAIQGDGQRRTIEIDLSSNEAYKGAMTQLHVLLPPGEGTAEVYSIGLHP